MKLVAGIVAPAKKKPPVLGLSKYCAIGQHKGCGGSRNLPTRGRAACECPCHIKAVAA